MERGLTFIRGYCDFKCFILMWDNFTSIISFAYPFHRWGRWGQRGCMTCPRTLLGIGLEAWKEAQVLWLPGPCLLNPQVPLLWWALTLHARPRVQQTGCLPLVSSRKRYRGGLAFSSLSLFWTPLWLLFLFFSYPYHSIGSLWKCFFGNATVNFVLYHIKNGQWALLTASLPHRRCFKKFSIFKFYSLKLYLCILHHSPLWRQTHFIVCNIGLSRCGNNWKMDCLWLYTPETKIAIFLLLHLMKKACVWLRLYKLKQNFVAEWQLLCVEV